MICWICHQECPKTNLCNCNNDFSYCHYECLECWIKTSNKNTCIMCKSYYKFPTFFIIKVFILNIIYEILDFLDTVCEYNLYTGQRWEEMYD